MGSLVSIIIPTYNRARILGRAINSVLEQTYANWELIVVDDGSSDFTPQVVESFRDDRIRYVHQENKGHQSAKNHGMEETRGEWITYIDDDDTFRPDFLKTTLSFIEQNPKTLWGFVRGTRYLELYENGKLVKSIDDSEDFPEHVTPQDIVYRKLHTAMDGAFHARKIIEDGVRFDPKLKFDDWDFFLTLSERYPENFLYIPIPLYDYWQRFGGDGMTSQSTYRTWAEQFEIIYQKHKDDRLMKGQTWYPDRVHKWNKLADDFEKGLLPPYHLYYFQDI